MGAGARRASSHWAGSWLCRGAPSTRTRLPRSWRRAHHLCGSHSPDHGHRPNHSLPHCCIRRELPGARRPCALGLGPARGADACCACSSDAAAPHAGKRFNQRCHGQTLDWLCLGGTGQQQCGFWARGELRRPPVPRCLALGGACGGHQGKLLAPLWACMWTRPAGAASASNEARARRAPHPEPKHAFLRAQASDGTNKLVVVRWDGSAWQVGVCG